MEPTPTNPDPIEPAPALGKPFTPTQIAADWGCSRPYARKQIDRGCPTDTLEAARAWRLANSVRGIGFRSKRKTTPETGANDPAQVDVSEGEGAASASVGGGGSVVPVETAPPEPPHEAQTPPDAPLRKESAIDSIEAALASAIDIEKQCHSMVVDAQTFKGSKDDIAEAQGRLPVLISAYTKALDNRLSAEERVQKLRERYGVLITADFAKQLIRKAWVPHITRLRSVAKRAAPKANPTDDIAADRAISEEIEDAIRETQEAFESAG